MFHTKPTCVVATAVVAGLLGAWLAAVPAADSPADAKRLANPFYAYCVGYGANPENYSLKSQCELAPIMANLGYAGTACVGLDWSTELLATLEKNGQKLMAVYTPLVVDPGARGYDPKLRELIPKLKGHGTIVWLVVNTKTLKPSSTAADDRAVELLREIADLARKYDVAISLYPHLGAYAQRIEDVVRLAGKTDRPNVGVTFNLCHFLALDQAKNLETALREARPYLTMVTINGTSGYDPKNRAGWIQLLGEGTFDVAGVLRILKKIEYRGPIGVQAYGINGDHREILSRTMQAWKKLSAQAAAN